MSAGPRHANRSDGEDTTGSRSGAGDEVPRGEGPIVPVGAVDARPDAERVGPGPVPAAAARLFGERLPIAVTYVEMLADQGVLRGLIGPREVPRLWGRHVHNSALVGDAIPRGVTLADIGSGAGLPGIPLAIARPDLDITLVEPMQRRVTWLTEVVDRLELTNVEIVRGRAEAQWGRRWDVVTARAVAHLSSLAEWCLPLVKEGGLLLAMKGAKAEDEVAETTLPRGVTSRLVVVGEGLVDEPTTLVELRLGTEVPVPGSRGRETRGRGSVSSAEPLRSGSVRGASAARGGDGSGDGRRQPRKVSRTGRTGGSSGRRRG